MAACGQVRKSFEFTTDKDVTLLTLSGAELSEGLETPVEIVPGQTWYLNVNGVNVTIKIPVEETLEPADPVE